MSETQPLRSTMSASNLSRRKLCPGSANMERGLPNEDSEWSKEGTLLHHLDAFPAEDRMALTEKQRHLLEINKGLRMEFLEHTLTKLGIEDMAEAKVFKERELFLCDADGNPIQEPEPFPGHPDIMMYFKKQRVMIIFDSKFGYMAVDSAEVNMQLKAYAVMIAENYDLESVFVAITQPRLAHPDNFHAAEYKGSDIAAHKAEILAIIEACKPKDAPLRASPGACNFCLALATCPAALATIPKIATTNPKDMKPAELEPLWSQCKVAEDVIEKVKGRMKYWLQETPDDFKVYGLGKPQIMRKVTDTWKAFEVLFGVGLLGEDRVKALELFVACSDVSRDMLKVKVAAILDKTQKECEGMIFRALTDNSVIEEKPKAAAIVEK